MSLDDTNESDVKWMECAIALARKGEGLTRPNPPVGSIIVKRGKIIGEGYHEAAGRPHAEAVALHQAGARADGAVLYVTLEPCNTYGRTPPCTELIIRHKVKRVVIGVRDPNPRHSGRGIARLRRAGISVSLGVCHSQCKEIVEPFASWILRGRPLLTLKLAVSLDGRIADTQGRSKWLTSSASRKLVQELRRRVDAVIVGAGTVLKDNPRLFPRPSYGRSPFRVILTSRGNIPPTRYVFRDKWAKRTIVAVSSRCPRARRASYARYGAEVIVLPSTGGMLDIDALLRELGRRGILHAVCEGGGRLASSLFATGVVDRIVLFLAPIILGDDGQSRPAVAGAEWLLSSSPKFELEYTRRLGDDLFLAYHSKERIVW